jgi:RND family efflux transporter MFP subunit
MQDETRSLKPDPQPENKSTPGPVDARSGGGGDAKDSRGDKKQSHGGSHKKFSAQSAKKIAFWAVVALVILLVISIVPRLIRRHHLASEKKTQENAVPSVTVVEAKAIPPTIDLELSGTMSALTEAPLLARANGFLVKRLADIGDRVHKGQLMAVISSPDLDQEVLQGEAALRETESALNQAQFNLNQAKANQGLAAVSAQRWARLQQKGAVSRQENDSYQTNFQAQNANVDATNAMVISASHNVTGSRASLERLRELQSFEQIRSPFDGIVTARNLDVGALISQGSTLLFRVAQIDVLRTYIQVPQTNAPVIYVGEAAYITFAEYPGRTFTGAITRKSESLDPTTRTMLTEVQLPNENHTLLPGMFASVKLSVPTTGNAVIIPGECLMVRASGPQVATVSDQNKIQIKQINVGHDYGNTVEVLGGLTAGEKVVVNPGDDVMEGANVKPVESKQQPENPSSTGGGTPGQATQGSKDKSGPKQQGGGQSQQDSRQQSDSSKQSKQKSSDKQ